MEGVIKKTCPECKNELLILESFLKYFNLYKKQEQRAVLTCPDCNTPIDFEDVQKGDQNEQEK